MIRSLALLLAVGSCLDPLTASAASLPEHASVEIDTSDVGDEGPIIKRRIEERTGVVLRGRGVLPARPQTDDPVVTIDIDPLTGPEPGYSFEIWSMIGEQPLGDKRQVECTLCTESEVVARIEATMLEHLETVELPPPPEESDEGAADPSPSPAEDDSGVDPSDPPTSDQDGGRARLGKLGRAGVGLLSVGLGGVIAGSVLVALPPKVNDDNPLEETTTRPPGFAVLGIGAAAALSGAIMLAIDRRRAKRRHTGRARRMDPRIVGVGSLRF